MKNYAKYLETVNENDPSKHDELTRKYCSEWALDSKEYRKEIKSLYAEFPEKEGWQGEEVQELREGKWQKELERQLKKIRKTPTDVERAAKSARWKIEIASKLKRINNSHKPVDRQVLADGPPKQGMQSCENI